MVTETAAPASARDLDPSSIEIRPLSTHAERTACVELQRSTWGDDFSDAVPASILKVAARIGGVVLGAFDHQGELLGFVFGLTGVERGRIVHWSDMLAVAPRARNLGLGRRLKEHQRALVRTLGAEVVYWTFDPLIARNAHLNFNRLGVRLSEYVEDMYGITDSILHGGVPTDRMVVAWPTHDEEIRARLSESERALASEDARQAPIATVEWIEAAVGVAILPHSVRVEIPLDGEALLLNGAGKALAWRESARRGMQWAIAAGYTVSAFLHDEASARGYYLMAKATRPSASNGRA